MEPEILINISFRLPQADRRALGEHLVDVIKEAIIAGGDTVHISLQPYDPDSDPFNES
jgi:aromatic ring-opening dioxygenase catalytic subunit (LigB family)